MTELVEKICATLEIPVYDESEITSITLPLAHGTTHGFDFRVRTAIPSGSILVFIAGYTYTVRTDDIVNGILEYHIEKR